MNDELELPAGRASMAHRAAVLNENYTAASLNGVPAIAAPVSGDAWAAYANRSMLTRSEYRHLMSAHVAVVLADAESYTLEPTC